MRVLRFLFCGLARCSLLAALCFNGRAAEVYGTFRQANTTPYVGEVLFRALSTPMNSTPAVITGVDYRITTETNGGFTIHLEPGNYRIFTKFDPKGFTIVVPESTNSLLLNSLITTALAYPPSATNWANTNVALAAASTYGVVRTDTSSATPVVYLKSSVDALLLGKIDTAGGSGSDITLSGTNYISDTLQVGNLLDLFYNVAAAPDSAAVSKLYVDRQTYLIVDTLAELLATTSPPNYRLARVRQDTASDGAAGEWEFDPSSSADERGGVKIPDDRSSITLGRWRQLR